MKDFSPLLYFIKNRIDKNRNAIIVINGSTGSGKTYAAIDLCKAISKIFNTNFKINTNMDFKFAELLKKMSHKDNQKPGTAFLFEEVGAFGGGASAREWQGSLNKFFNSFLQTSRHKNQVLVMTCPLFANLEAGSRKLCHIQMEMAGINVMTKTSKAKTYRLQVNMRTGNMYFKYFRVKKGGSSMKVKHSYFHLPHPALVAQYESLKSKYTEELNANIVADQVEKAKKKLRYPAKCNKCNYEWQSSKEMPGKCPKCSNRDTKGVDLGDFSRDMALASSQT